MQGAQSLDSVSRPLVLVASTLVDYVPRSDAGHPDQIEDLKMRAWSEWDYLGSNANDDECPFEWKPSDWGDLNGRLVAVDYAATAAHLEPQPPAPQRVR